MAQSSTKTAPDIRNQTDNKQYPDIALFYQNFAIYTSKIWLRISKLHFISQSFSRTINRWYVDVPTHLSRMAERRCHVGTTRNKKKQKMTCSFYYREDKKYLLQGFELFDKVSTYLRLITIQGFLYYIYIYILNP